MALRVAHDVEAKDMAAPKSQGALDTLGSGRDFEVLVAHFALHGEDMPGVVKASADGLLENT
jgi:hypothetical protein